MTVGDYPQHVTLRNGTTVEVRPLEPTDGPALLAFFRGLPEEDRLFLRDDVTRQEVADRFVQNIDPASVFPIVAVADGAIVGEATLHRQSHGWKTHVAEIRVVVGRDLQRSGLGTALARLLVKEAVNAGLDKLVAEVVENQAGARRAFEKIGFRVEAVLKNHVKDIRGMKRDLVIMSNDVSHLWDRMEAMVSDFSPSMGG